MGRLEVAYPHEGAMRRPETRDRHGERHYSHVFFVSIRLELINTGRGAVGLLKRVYLLIHFFINLNVKRMKKNFLLLLLMALLPLAGWATDYEVKVYGGEKHFTYNSVAVPGSLTADMLNFIPTTLTDEVKNAVVAKLQYAFSGTALTTTSDAGTYGFTVSLISAGDRVVTDGVDTYTITVQDPEGSFVVDNAAGPAPKTAPTFVTEDLTYNGQKQNLLKTKGEALDGFELEYSTDNTNWADDAYMVTNANTTGYTVYYRTKAKKNYNASASEHIASTKVVAKGTPTVTAPTDAENWMYDGKTHQLLTAAAIADFGEVRYAYQYKAVGAATYDDWHATATKITSANLKVKDAGTYKIRYYAAGDANCNQSDIKYVYVTVAQANLTVVAEDKNFDYDGTTTVKTYYDAVDLDKKYSCIGLLGEDTKAVVTETSVSYADADKDEFVAGDYPLTASGSKSNNYKIFFQPGKLTINKLPLVIKAENKTMTLGDAEPKYTITITGAINDTEKGYMTAADKGKAKAERADNANTIGEHVIKVDYDDAADVFNNYDVKTENGTLTISGGTIVVTVKPQTIAYGDDETWSTPQEGRDYFVNGIAEADKSKLTVTLTRKDAEKKTPGEYAITASANTPAGYDAVNFVNSTLTIEKKQLQVTALDQTLAVGQKVSALDITKIDFADGHGMAFDEDPADVLELAFADGVTVDGTTKALKAGGPYNNGIEVKLKGGSNACYTLTMTAGKLTVGTALVLNRPNKAAYDADNAADDAAAVIAAANGQTVSVTFSDFAMVKEKWYPMVLPFDTSVKEISEALGYAVVNLLNDGNPDKTKITFKLHMGDIPANTPFVVKNYDAKNLSTVTFTGKTIVNSADPSVSDDSGVKFIGSYSHKQGFAANEAFFSVSADKNNYYWGSATNTTYSAPLSAYFQIPEGSPARTIEFQEADGTVTAIKAVAADFNGKNAEGWYTIGGVKLQAAPTQKGVYIKDGKKFVIK